MCIVCVLSADPDKLLAFCTCPSFNSFNNNNNDDNNNNNDDNNNNNGDNNNNAICIMLE